jgi:hypothetical protein
MGALTANGNASNSTWVNVSDDGSDVHTQVGNSTGIYTDFELIGSSPQVVTLLFATEVIATSVASITVAADCVFPASVDSLTLSLRRGGAVEIGTQTRTSTGAFSFSASSPGTLTQADVDNLNIIVTGTDPGLAAGSLILKNLVVTLTQASGSIPNHFPATLGFSLGLGL